MRNTVILLLSLTVMVIMSNASKIITYDGECDYDCSGWPYKQCKVTLTYKNGAWKRAGCTSPYYSRSSYRMQSNYPSCTRLSQTVGSECDRCDDVCSQRDGLDKNDYTETGPKYPVAYDPPTPPSPNPEDCFEIKERRVCCSDYGECSGWSRPHTMEASKVHIMRVF